MTPAQIAAALTPAQVARLVQALQGLLLAVDTYADTAPQSDAEIAASGDVSLAAEAARAVLAELENRHD